jgi:uncharacterized membrane protein YagU involved in acid resistance
LAGWLPPHRAHLAGVSRVFIFAFGYIVLAAAFDADKRFVAVRFGVAILLTSHAVGDVVS